MKKFLILVLTVMCLFSFAMASACSKETNKTSDIVLINGFNVYDDIASFNLNPTTFGGSFSINKDKDYIVEGEGSWKIYVETTYANQPNFKVKATNLKNDITDVSEFRLWVHSNAKDPFEIIITAYSGDTIVCAPTATVNEGVNELSFKINRALVAQNGQIITDYSISFSGIKGGTTLYLDNFSAKTTTEPVQLKAEVKEVINAIASFNDNTTREDLEIVMNKYRALSAEDKLCVSNYSTLNAAIEPYYISDLAQAQLENPRTWLYFGDPFGEVQVEGITQGISSYMYSEEQQHGKDKGSLKIEFTTTSTNWLTLSTSALTIIEQPDVEFYVYNDSDQVKAMCVGWKAPVNANGVVTYFVIAPRTWTKINCTADCLYDAGGASGGIQICGLSDMLNRTAQPPEGAMYFSSFVKIDDQKDAEEARTGDDANTLYFFDREFGVRQVSGNVDIISYNYEFAYTTEMKHGEDAGSLAVTLEDKDASDDKDFQIVWKQFGYEFNEGDYVVFYVYNDSDYDIVDISLGNTHRQRCLNGEWTTVIWKASDVADSSLNWSKLIGYNYGDTDYAGRTWGKVSGTVYISKVKVYSAEQVKDLTTVDSTYEYTIGKTTLVGAPSLMNGDYAENPAAFNDANFTNPYYVNGLLRWQIHAAKTQTEKQPMVGFKFKNNYEITSNCYLYVTVKGAVEGQVYAQIFNDNGYVAAGHIATPSGTLVETLPNGFAIYKFHVGNYVGNAKATNLNAFRMCVRYLKYPHTGEVVVSNIEVVYETAN